MSTLKLEEAMKRADQVIKLAELFDKAFSPEYSQEHLKMAIAAGIADAYNHGANKGFNAGKLSAQIG
jgi:hypothetical protein